MIVAFDIDDTITRHPEFFAFLSASLRDAGHRVLIITFRENRDATIADLRKWGIEYDDVVTSTLEGTLQAGVDEWKAAVCLEHQVDIFFEDDPEVLKHIDDVVLCMMPVDRRRHVLAAISPGT